MIIEKQSLDIDSIKSIIEHLNNRDDLQELVLSHYTYLERDIPMTFSREWTDEQEAKQTFINDEGIHFIADAIENKKIGTIQKLRITDTYYLNESQIQILFDAFQKNDNLFELEVHTGPKEYIKSKDKNIKYYKNKLMIVENHYKNELKYYENKIKDYRDRQHKLTEAEYKFKNLNTDAINADTFSNLEKYVDKMQNKINKLVVPNDFSEELQFIFDLKHDLKEFQKHWCKIKKLNDECIDNDEGLNHA